MSSKRVLFVCTGNAARSQMAEGWARAMAPAGVEVYSAGTHPAGVSPLAVEVMKERDVDISQHRSKSLTEVPVEMVWVITLCAQADAECPTLGARVERLAWHLPDPARGGRNEEEARRGFRETRDEIEQRVRNFFARPEFSAARESGAQ